MLGTSNRKKGIELAELLVPWGFELKTLANFPEVVEVTEDGETFAENAALKATQQARHLGQWVLGEDSGLVVDALGGEPGVYSARYAGQHATDWENNERLLKELGETQLAKRTAHYVCHMTLSDPSGRILAETEGYCQGRITFAPVGSEGFGYDPLFEIVEYHHTFAELGSGVKRLISHRAQVMRQLLPQIVALVQQGEWPAVESSSTST